MQKLQNIEYGMLPINSSKQNKNKKIVNVVTLDENVTSYTIVSE